MDTVRFCLVGAGRAGMVDARNFQFNVNRSEVVAVVDPAIENARKSAEELDASYYRDFDEALQNEEFEAVCIGVPTFIHAEAIIRAVSAGKHIFTEKPLSITLEEADLIRKAIEENKIKLQIGFMRRFDKRSRRYRKTYIN